MRIIGDLVLAGFGQLKNARIENLASDPGAPQNGQIWFNTTDGVYRGYNGTDIITFANGGNTQAIIDALAAETTARQNADTTLTNNLATEVTARTDADTTLTNNLATETTARTNADSTLTTNLATETTARTDADTTLTNNLATESTTRANADTTLQNNINAEATTRADADTTLQNNINAEATTRAAQDAAVTTAFQNADSTIRTDFGNADTTIRSDLGADIATEASLRTAADALRVLKAGDTMSGNLAFGGVATVTGLAAPTGASDAATKNYVDSTVSGLSWKQAVAAAVADHTTEAHASGKRVLDLTNGNIYTSDGAAWDAGVAAADGDAVFDKTNETGYVYSGTTWTQFTGTGQVAAGVGLSKTGNQIDVNLGAGISQLPSDEVGLDVRATGGVFLTEDGTTPSTGTAAQLAIRLANSTLTLGASGIEVSSALTLELSSATSAIAAETTNRVAAVSAEATARADADTTLTNSLAAESTTRANADTTLTNNLAAESTSRADADTTLTNNLATEVTARTNADTTLTNNLATETTARTDADNTLQSNLNAEATTRANADLAEATARADADTTINTRITNGHFVYTGGTAATSHTVTHNIGVKYCQVIVVDSADKVIIPDVITFVDTNSLTVDFISAITCKVAVTAAKAL